MVKFYIFDLTDHRSFKFYKNKNAKSHWILPPKAPRDDNKNLAAKCCIHHLKQKKQNPLFMNSKIRIMVADPQEIFRKSISLLLKLQDDFNVCGEAANGRELSDKLKIGSYNVVLLDNPMPLEDGRTALSIMQARFPEIKVVVLSSHYDVTGMSEYMTEGAACCLLKTCDVNTLFSAIRTVHQDGYYFDKTISEAILLGLRNVSQTGKNNAFTNREMVIIRKICDGLSNKQIALSLNISRSTVDFHKGKIYTKTNCSSASELLKFALKKGLINLV